jgi:hypothetical protein
MKNKEKNILKNLGVYFQGRQLLAPGTSDNARSTPFLAPTCSCPHGSSLLPNGNDNDGKIDTMNKKTDATNIKTEEQT